MISFIAYQETIFFLLTHCVVNALFPLGQIYHNNPTIYITVSMYIVVITLVMLLHNTLPFSSNFLHFFHLVQTGRTATYKHQEFFNGITVTGYCIYFSFCVSYAVQVLRCTSFLRGFGWSSV